MSPISLAFHPHVRTSSAQPRGPNDSVLSPPATSTPTRAESPCTSAASITGLLAAYPEVIRLVTVLTDLSFASYLLSPRFSLAEQVWALEAAVITIMQGSTATRLHAVAEKIASRGRAAVESAFGMRRNAHNKRPATLEKASSPHHNDKQRACFVTSAPYVSRSCRTSLDSPFPGVARSTATGRCRILWWSINSLSERSLRGLARLRASVPAQHDPRMR